jgi:uncharacterized repeat protein (TIGR03803 family)
VNRIQAIFDPSCRRGLPGLRVALLASAASATFVTTCLTPLAGFAATGIRFQTSVSESDFRRDYPYAALTPAGNGLYYGTTVYGGFNNKGAIFLFDSATGLINPPPNFNGNYFENDSSNGANPQAALTAAGNGLFYGTTTAGGANNKGAIFLFDSATGSITLQDSFSGSNGAIPQAALTAAGNGLFYGTTEEGGANDEGAIFEFNSATGSITLKDSFSGSNGAIPVAALTAAGNGLYYGTTIYGGANNQGAIFEFNSATGLITLKDSFAADYSNGANPTAALTAAGNGLYYGTTSHGGANDNGAIFEFDSATGSITLKDSFAADSSNGANPYAALAAAGNGLYYGTTFYGGANDNGAIFEFNSATGLITLKDSFAADYSNGAYPYAALTAAGNGLFYGTTVRGGDYNSGVIFSFSDSVPGPLPVVGIGAAFGWSRQLRRRVAQASPRKA